MAVRVVAEVVDDLGELRAQKRDFGHRPRIGRGREETDYPQFADDIAVLVETLDPDIVHMGAAMDDRTHIGLGNDQEIGTVQKIEDFRRGHHLILALAQHQDVRIGKNAQASGACT